MVKVIVGMMGSSVAKGSASVATLEQVKSFLNVVKSHGVKELDTARVYNAGRSEELLGEVGAPKDFLVATKAPGFASGSLSEASILSNAEKSFAALKQEEIDLYYIHGPDRDTPLEDTCRAIGKLWKQGRFERFGISNLRADEVQTIHDICKREGYCLPTVYQGGYNPIHRNAEKGLFPTLRQLNMSFYAYSPLAGGLLAKPIDEMIKPKPGTRFDLMPVFGQIYLNATNIAALKKIHDICDKNGVSSTEATMRWFMHHAPLAKEDGIILGASTEAQVEATLSACEKGPLPTEVAEGFERLWDEIREQGLPYHC
ncbi:hypothetical protein H2198_003271 [Neophaeococcomyces mojaviensis]|uniref:Uncharacterized protein n=1 Tax=Neophaeococcomyces mojaviensis TaxID=3383035 RepID=A0ACC3ABU8_9EURO|nr:hypothetical protein H2198_003271 [Knufia sp. JES_112]